MIVGCIYRPPWVDVCTFNVLLNNMLDSLHKKHYVFLLGDFNVDLSPDIETTVAVEEFQNLFCSHHLFPLINKPTRETKSSKTIIDNIYCNIPHVLDINNIGIIRTYISDHHAIFCLFNETKLQDYKQNSTMKRSFCEKNMPSFLIILQMRLGILFMKRVHSRGSKALFICSLANAFQNDCLK